MTLNTANGHRRDGAKLIVRFYKMFVMVQTNFLPRDVILSLKGPMALADTINGRRGPSM